MVPVLISFEQALLQTDETWANQKHIQENSRAREGLAEIAADNASELANSASGRKLVEDGSELFKAKDEATYKDETVNLDEFNSIEHPYQSDYRPNEEANVYAKYATENGEKPVNVSTSDVANNLKEKAQNVIDNTSVEDVVNVGDQVVDIVIEKAKYNAGHVKENIRTTPEQLGELAIETLNSLKQVFENNDEATLAEIKELQGNKQEAIELKEKGLVTTGETLTTIATVGGIGKNLTKKAAGDIVESVDLPEIPAVGSIGKPELSKLDNNKHALTGSNATRTETISDDGTRHVSYLDLNTSSKTDITINPDGDKVEVLGDIDIVPSGRAKGRLPKMDLPEGFHRGHSTPEAGAQNQARVNVIENLEPEAASSNLGLKKSVEAIAIKIKKESPESNVQLRTKALQRDQETGIPKAMQQTVIKDGEVKCDICILNKNQPIHNNKSKKSKDKLNVIEE